MITIPLSRSFILASTVPNTKSNHLLNSTQQNDKYELSCHLPFLLSSYLELPFHNTRKPPSGACPLFWVNAPSSCSTTSVHETMIFPSFSPYRYHSQDLPESEPGFDRSMQIRTIKLVWLLWRCRELRGVRMLCGVVLCCVLIQVSRSHIPSRASRTWEMEVEGCCDQW